MLLVKSLTVMMAGAIAASYSLMMASVMRLPIWTLAGCFCCTFVACRQAEQPAAPVASQTAPATPAKPADTRPRIVAFGDSLSAGYGADPGQSFPDYLQALIDQDQRLYHVVNEGVSGDTTTDGVQRLPNVLADQPRVVILEFGGNDGLRGLPVKTTRANLEQMIVALQKSGAKVVLAGMTLPRNYGQEYIHPFEQMYVALARQYHLSRIPFLLNGVASDPKLMQPDSIHPTAKGNAIVAKTVYQYVKPLL
jgi:acyl-CoA thioesterase-1